MKNKNKWTYIKNITKPQIEIIIIFFHFIFFLSLLWGQVFFDNLHIVCGFQVIEGNSVVLFLFLKKLTDSFALILNKSHDLTEMHLRNSTAQCLACFVVFLRTSDQSGLTVCCWWLLCFFGITLEHWNWTESGGYFFFVFTLQKKKKKKKKEKCISVSFISKRHTHITEWEIYAGAVSFFLDF